MNRNNKGGNNYDHNLDSSNNSSISNDSGNGRGSGNSRCGICNRNSGSDTSRGLLVLVAEDESQEQSY